MTWPIVKSIIASSNITIMIVITTSMTVLKYNSYTTVCAFSTGNVYSGVFLIVGPPHPPLTRSEQPEALIVNVWSQSHKTVRPHQKWCELKGDMDLRTPRCMKTGTCIMYVSYLLLPTTSRKHAMGPTGSPHIESIFFWPFTGVRLRRAQRE